MDHLVLLVRILLTTLFLIFGWRKLRDRAGTVAQMAQLRVPTPRLAATVATIAEVGVAFAVAVGAFTRVAALVMALYTLGTALFGHRYWDMTGTERIENMDSFYKNLGIVGGFLLLFVTGPGRYSVDAWCARGWF